MSRVRSLPLAALLVACAAPPADEAAPRQDPEPDVPPVEAVSGPTRKSTWVEELDGHLVLRFGDDRLFEARHQAQPVPFFWPLFAPGEIPVTRAYPMAEVEGEERDHPHHRSFWIAHGDVNGVDFWHDGGPLPGRIENTGRLFERISRRKRMLLGFEYAWKDPEGKTLLVERRRIEFGTEDTFRWLDFELLFRPTSADVTFGDTKEGFFALRLRPELRLEGERATGRAVNSEGVEGKDVWGQRAGWVHYQGTVGDEVVGVAVFDHPANPRFPTWWHARAYGLLAANPFGAHDFEGAPEGSGDYVLPLGEELTLRYRVWIHRGARTPGEIAEQAEVYALQVPAGR